jgi:hypothetical protein
LPPLSLTTFTLLAFPPFGLPTFLGARSSFLGDQEFCLTTLTHSRRRREAARLAGVEP